MKEEMKRGSGERLTYSQILKELESCTVVNNDHVVIELNKFNQIIESLASNLEDDYSDGIDAMGEDA